MCTVLGHGISAVDSLCTTRARAGGYWRKTCQPNVQLYSAIFNSAVYYEEFSSFRNGDGTLPSWMNIVSTVVAEAQSAKRKPARTIIWRCRCRCMIPTSMYSGVLRMHSNSMNCCTATGNRVLPCMGQSVTTTALLYTWSVLLGL